MTDRGPLDRPLPPWVRAAHAAGLKVIMVPDLQPATEEIGKLAHRVMPSLHEVRAVLNEWVTR